MSPKFEKKKQNLASLCGIHRDSLDQYIAMPGFPKKAVPGWPVEACRQFIFRNAKKEEVAASNDVDYAELKRLDLYERWQKTKIANDLKKGVVVLKSHMDAQLAAQSAAITAHLTPRASRIAPDLAGRTIPEIERIEKEYDREILRSLAKHVHS